MSRPGPPTTSPPGGPPLADAADLTGLPAAELDRRFYAFTIDRLIAWPLDLGAALLAYGLVADGSTVAGVLVVVATALLVGLAFSMAVGLTGLTPGKALLGLRVVRHASGTPIGVPAALLRTLVLGVGGLPTFGLGVATLAWTAVMDPGRQRRGWHDRVADSIVVDVRPVPTAVPEHDPGPRQIVNLTAMRLAPVPRPVPVAPPNRGSRPTTATAPAASPAPGPDQVAAPPTAPTPTPTPTTPERRFPRGPLAPRHAAEPAEPPQAPAPQPVPGLPAEPTSPRPPGAPTAERAAQPDGPAAGLAGWRVTFDTGQSLLVEGLTLLGRRPEPRPGEPVRHLVPLPSQDMSLSKTHAQLQVAADGVLVVTDRGSTNGSVLVRRGVARDLPAGRPTTLLSGDLVRLGDRQMTVAREG